MSIGFTNPVGGCFGATPNPGIHASPLGGGLPGFIPQATNDSNNYDEYAQMRFTLKQAWNTMYPAQLKKSHAKRMINHSEPLIMLVIFYVVKIILAVDRARLFKVDQMLKV